MSQHWPDPSHDATRELDEIDGGAAKSRAREEETLVDAMRLTRHPQLSQPRWRLPRVARGRQAEHPSPAHGVTGVNEGIMPSEVHDGAKSLHRRRRSPELSLQALDDIADLLDPQQVVLPLKNALPRPIKGQHVHLHVERGFRPGRHVDGVVQLVRAPVSQYIP